MKKKITDIIRIDGSLSTPIYKQIVHSICDCIEKGKLQRNDMLPSVNNIAETFSLARGSVFTAYNDLRASGIIDSIPGKGYFITSTRLHQKKKVFILFPALSERTTCIYNSITKYLGDECSLNLYVYQHDIRIFQSLINEHVHHFNTFVIVPEIHGDAASALAPIDERHLFLLDAGYREFGKTHYGVYRNPEKELHQLFEYFEKRMGRYKRIFLVLTKEQSDSNLITVFRKKSKNLDATLDVLYTIPAAELKKGDAFIVYDDQSLAAIVKQSASAGYGIGKDVGIISYQEHILKEVVADGITTFSTDTEAMGKSIASMICTGSRSVVVNPSIIIDRKSF